VEKPLKVLLYGDTLVLAGLQASLASYPGLEVTDLDRPAAGDEELCSLRPDVIIFDVAAVQPEFQYALVEKLPGLLLIGIDPSANRVLAWRGQQLHELSTGDLVELIERQPLRFHVTQTEDTSTDSM
jgi:hypothetical protein